MRVLSSVLVLLAMTPHAVRGDDGAASIAAGGVVLMKRETRIVMAREVLSISPSKVVVDYDFRNDSDEDITTEVAFPIPAYTLDADSFVTPRFQGFDDFRLWVAQQPRKFTTETRAFVGKRDITALLVSMRIDPGSMGHFKWPDSGLQTTPDIDRLTTNQKLRLVSAGAIARLEDGQPLWRIEKKYHWTQTFPAHGVVHVRHAYTPVLGNSNTTGYGYAGQPATEKPVEELATVCPADSLLAALRRAGNTDKELVGISYVDFILTTANTWKTPIEDFTLNVKRESAPGYKVNYASFCWDGPVERVDADHFSAHVDGLVPRKELRIGFIRSDWTNKQIKEHDAWEIAHPRSRNQ